MKKTFAHLLIGIAIITTAVSQYAFKPQTAASYQIGDTVKDFKLKGVDGKYFSLYSDLNVKGYVVIFTCNHCPFSVKYEDRIIDIHRRFAPQGYPVVAINSNDSVIVPEDSFGNMVIRAKDKNFSFLYLYDQTQKIAHQFGAARTPHVFIVQRTGKEMKLRYMGAIDNNADVPEEVSEMYVEQALTELIAGREVSQNSTKAIGCTIKWRKTE